ncbi:Methionine aminopeptidase 1D, chloroplastic/mitochondrial [Symbiodinium microadriaticum]|uniref:Methionine aminopeptidase 1D, chloroplastic/mitochondrial n=1 Tax=Symbiodinium microadriaticum TaxID=2951 RepID=A0A1Q9CVE0_SYMMI|nr:Methionine aminopeptidase 1D, chloroplastic/mitochondrial [Symbiodinium microadriaticum]
METIGLRPLMRQFLKRKVSIERDTDTVTLRKMRAEVARDAVRPGATTDEIDREVHDFIVSRGAYPSPLGYLGFPKSVSTSVNDVIAHGIPDDRPLEDGDILNVDVTVYVDGHHGDTSSMFVAGTTDESGWKLCKAAQEAMEMGVEDEYGYYVSQIFLGHGVGSYFHGQPVLLGS